MLTLIDDVYALGIKLIVVFGFVFLAQKLDSVVAASIPFVILYASYGYLVPKVAKYVGKLGGRRSIIISMCFLALSSAPMYAFASDENPVYLAFWAMLFLLGKLFLHVPFIYNLGRYTIHKDRGKSLSIKRISIVVVSLAGPFFGGLVSENFGLAGLMVTGAIVFVIGILPALMLEEFHFELKYDPKKLEKNLGTRKLAIFSFFCQSSSIIDVFWAIFVFVITGESFKTLGLIFTVVALINIVVSFLLGKYLDDNDRIKFLGKSAVINAVSWVARALSFNFLTVFISDLIYKLNANILDSTFEVVTYDLMNDRLKNENRDEIIVYRDQILNYIISFGWGLGAIMISMFGFQSAFLLAAVISLGFLLLRE